MAKVSPFMPKVNPFMPKVPWVDQSLPDTPYLDAKHLARITHHIEIRFCKDRPVPVVGSEFPGIVAPFALQTPHGSMPIMPDFS